MIATLLCNISLEDQQYYSDVVFLFNTKTEELQVIDKGRVWQGKVVLDIEKQIKFPALNQEELNMVGIIIYRLKKMYILYL